MGNAYSAGVATTQFYLYGRRHCTRIGWEKASSAYSKPDPLDAADLTGRVVLVTGANSGIGREIAKCASAKHARVYMLCRSAARAQQARDEIAAETSNDDVHVLLGDCGRKADIERVVAELSAREGALDALVCNAGVLLNARTETPDGHEVTFATHLLFGSYFLASALTPLLEASASPIGPRCVFVSSGGMYNRKWPSHWDVAASSGDGAAERYDGQLAYVYAKRGQVLLAERWARDTAAAGGKVAWVSAHPGWVDTPAVEEAYGANRKYLEPMRSPWEGAEGISWLACAAVAPGSPAAVAADGAAAADAAASGDAAAAAARERLVSGAFYLDRSPQVKHLAGPFMSEGSYTKNTEPEVDAMMKGLADAVAAPAPAPAATPDAPESAKVRAASEEAPKEAGSATVG